MFSGARVYEVVTADRFAVLIREKRERVSRLLREIARSLRRIDADRYRTNSLRVETV